MPASVIPRRKCGHIWSSWPVSLAGSATPTPGTRMAAAARNDSMRRHRRRREGVDPTGYQCSCGHPGATAPLRAPRRAEMRVESFRVDERSPDCTKACDRSYGWFTYGHTAALQVRSAGLDGVAARLDHACLRRVTGIAMMPNGLAIPEKSNSFYGWGGRVPPQSRRPGSFYPSLEPPLERLSHRRQANAVVRHVPLLGGSQQRQKVV